MRALRVANVERRKRGIQLTDTPKDRDRLIIRRAREIPINQVAEEFGMTRARVWSSRIESALRNGPSRIVPSSPSSSAERWLTKADVAERFQVSPRTISNWLRLGYLPHVRLGRLVRFQMRDIENQMEARDKIFGRSGYPSRRGL